MEEKLISEFNEAKWQIFRLHNLWQQAKIQRETANLAGWRWTLDSAAIELNNDADRLSTDKESFIEKLKELDKEIDDAANEANFSLLYSKLKDKEILLRKIQEDAGKGGKLKLEDDEGM